MKCEVCGAELTRDEIGLSRKLLGRASKACRCINCLSAAFRVGVPELQALIDRFKAAGCTMFR